MVVSLPLHALIAPGINRDATCRSGSRLGFESRTEDYAAPAGARDIIARHKPAWIAAPHAKRANPAKAWP